MCEQGQKLKEGFLPKKRVGRRDINLTIHPYKSRWFVLTERCLSYYDGAHEDGPRHLKSSIPLNNFRAVEPVQDGSLDGKFNAFQVVFVESVTKKKRVELTLYVVASDSAERVEWIKALHEAWRNSGDCDANPMYHPQAWRKDRYPCCDSREKSQRGCRHTQWRGSARRGPLPKPPDQPPEPPAAVVKRVIALFDRPSEEPNYLKLRKGFEYAVIQDDGKWLRCKNSQGEEGLVPANFVQDKETYRKNLDKYDWFYGNIDKTEAANVLCGDGRPGCFLVRQSSDVNHKYTLCLLVNPQTADVRYYHIKQNEEGLYYVSIDKPFEMISTLIDYHGKNPGGLAVRLQFWPVKDGVRNFLQVPDG